MNTIFFIGQIIGVVPLSVLLLLVLAKLVSLQRRGGGGVRLQDGSGHGVLITGCDSGFGHQLARALDDKRFTVFAGFLYPDGAGAQSLTRTCSRNLRVLKLDVTRDQDVQHAKRTVQDNLPEKGLWAVVNNAGVTDWAEIEWSSVEDFRSMAEINLFGAIRVSVAFLPLIRAAKGRMVFTSSIFAFFNCLTMGAYSVSKRGLEAFADCLRVETASFGVKVSIIQPGNFGRATNILRMKTGLDIWEKLDEERKRTFNRKYIDLANEYFMSTCKAGFKDGDMVIDAMLHAILAPRPRCRYLLASARDTFFFQMVPFLPSGLTDAVFKLSSMYQQRSELLHAK
ncbi:D-beta-hydroxybutyrate dehydrogenase, mitochondrial [Centropristis striata]|uniref:D-beta-hydroxybutyrate dehydrogenase, mitochondrial n=1 Tax=Centropristis striata TaxID=184440 RepID=UPI0027DF771F|nr:D-beta-hydroxybutyrate dehydrogenase, mitochondrial [Centropristis striata]